MSILTSASRASVSRGYDYYNSDRVSEIIQINDDEYEAYVEGNRKTPYYVKINIKHPRKSYCDCPHANGNITCKHMVALYFSIFEDEAEDYLEWTQNNYDEDDYDEYEYNYDYDEYDGYYGYNEEYIEHRKFEKPLFFDEVLDNYVDSLEKQELKKILKEELKKNERNTFEIYLKNDYKKYLQNNNENYIFLDKINKKVKELTGYYDYNYNNFNKEILTIREKEIIEKIYNNVCIKNQIDKILLIPELAVYSDYKWIANFYKKNKSETEIKLFCKQLEEYLTSLKHYSIKNNVPKSNILIIIYLLNEYTLNELTNSLLKNAKYIGYVDYVVENTKNYLELYNKIMSEVDKNYFRYKRYLPDLLYRFVHVDEFKNSDIHYNCILYSFLYDGTIESLRLLEHFKDKNSIIKDIEKNTKAVSLLNKVYKYFNETEKLWNLLNNDTNRYLLINNIDELKENYYNELYEYFIEQFYETLKIDKKREVYKDASRYVKAISKLEDGKNLVNQLILELKKSEYQKCSALFDEINIAIK